MAFDATKLIVGKKYPTRDCKSGRYLGELQGRKDYRLVFATIAPNESCESISVHADDGRFSFHYVTSGRDIISDEPIKEPVSVPIRLRYACVFLDGSIGEQCESKAIAEARLKIFSGAIGVAELPETILVQPK